MVLSSAHTGVSGQENDHIPDKLDYVGSGRRESMEGVLIAQGFVAGFVWFLCSWAEAGY